MSRRRTGGATSLELVGATSKNVDQKGIDATGKNEKPSESIASRKRAQPKLAKRKLNLVTQTESSGFKKKIFWGGIDPDESIEINEMDELDFPAEQVKEKNSDSQHSPILLDIRSKEKTGGKSGLKKALPSNDTPSLEADLFNDFCTPADAIIHTQHTAPDPPQKQKYVQSIRERRGRKRRLVSGDSSLSKRSDDKQENMSMPPPLYSQMSFANSQMMDSGLSQFCTPADAILPDQASQPPPAPTRPTTRGNPTSGLVSQSQSQDMLHNSVEPVLLDINTSTKETLSDVNEAVNMSITSPPISRERLSKMTATSPDEYKEKYVKEKVSQSDFCTPELLVSPPILPRKINL